MRVQDREDEQEGKRGQTTKHCFVICPWYLFFCYILAVHYTTQVILFYFNDEIYMQMSENKEQMDIIILSRFVKMGKR